MKTLIFLFTLTLSIPLFGQSNLKLRPGKVHNKIPKDLDQSKIIVIKYDKFEIGNDVKGVKRIEWKRINKKEKFDMWNAQLKSEMKAYPFPYEIIDLDDLQSYMDQGYKYVLEFSASINLNRERGKLLVPILDAGMGNPAGAAFAYMFRFRNLETGERYYIPREFNATGPVALPKVLPRLIKYIKKKYKIK